MRHAHITASQWAFLIGGEFTHNIPKNKKAARQGMHAETRFLTGMTMQRLMIASLLLLTAACDTAGESKTATQTKLIQTSAVHWDEVAAASSAAHVNNNGLIMMR